MLISEVFKLSSKSNFGKGRSLLNMHRNEVENQMPKADINIYDVECVVGYNGKDETGNFTSPFSC